MVGMHYPLAILTAIWSPRGVLRWHRRCQWSRHRLRL